MYHIFVYCVSFLSILVEYYRDVYPKKKFQWLTQYQFVVDENGLIGSFACTDLILLIQNKNIY